MMVYKIEFYAYLPKISIYIFFFILISGRIRIRIFFQLSQIRIRGKKCRILIPGKDEEKIRYSTMKYELKKMFRFFSS